MTKTDKLVAISARELIADSGSINGAINATINIINCGDLPKDAIRFYRRVFARLQTMKVNDASGISELAAHDLGSFGW